MCVRGIVCKCECVEVCVCERGIIGNMFDYEGIESRKIPRLVIKPAAIASYHHTIHYSWAHKQTPYTTVGHNTTHYHHTILYSTVGHTITHYHHTIHYSWAHYHHTILPTRVECGNFF